MTFRFCSRRLHALAGRTRIAGRRLSVGLCNERSSFRIPNSGLRIPNCRPVARRFCRNDTAGTGFAHRHFTLLRQGDPRVLPRDLSGSRCQAFLAFDLVRHRQDVSAMSATNRKSAGLQNHRRTAQTRREEKPLCREFHVAAPGTKLVASPGRQIRKFRNRQSAIRQFPWLFAPIPKPRPCSPRAKFCTSSAPADRFRDCAVLVRNLDDYHKPLARVFRRYEIPFFLDRRESVAHHPLAELTRSALRTVAFDWPHDDWFAALKAGFSPVDETEIDQLENAALEFGWHGKKWREPIQIADDPGLAKSLERLRQKILPPFENFAAQLARSQQPADRRRNSPTLCVELWDELRRGRDLGKLEPARTGKFVTRHSVTRHSIRPFGNR